MLIPANEFRNETSFNIAQHYFSSEIFKYLRESKMKNFFYVSRNRALFNFLVANNTTPGCRSSQTNSRKLWDNLKNE